MRSIGIKPSRLTDPRSGEGHPAPATKKMAVHTQPTRKPRFDEAFCVSGHARERELVAWCATRYTFSVIKSFKHKGLRKYYESGSRAGIQAKHAGRLRLQLAALDTARLVEDMDVPGYRLHPLKGRAKNRWSIWVSGNWRLTFEFKDGNAHVLDYEDYH
jgi:proteic killer suppression protein